MQIRMLSGPAGSGKTYRCLAEIREELAVRPDGKPLIFLAPKQATFQLERQLLGDGSLEGFSRLRIFSFQRLARFIFKSCGVPLPRLLSNEGRLMVLRALLSGLERRLTIFRSSARRLGFAEEASEQLREFQQHGLSPNDLRLLSWEAAAGPVREKLMDLASLYEAYQGWLVQNRLQDEELLLSLAAELLERKSAPPSIAGVWFDGFAQITPRERQLLGAILGDSERGVLFFCLDRAVTSQISPWYLVSQMFEKCRAEFETRFGKESVVCEWLDRSGNANRFVNAPALAHLERNWPTGETFNEPHEAIRFWECADPEIEVMACAREIVRFVRAGGRYRDVAVLMRSFLNDYPHLIRRVFARYQIPFFLDHREGVAHHPVAELTRGAFRMLLFNWKHQDCFTVLKTGLMPIRSDYLDELENAALEYGWEGEAWRKGFRLKKDILREEQLNSWRASLVRPFERFGNHLKDVPSGSQLARAIRELWAELKIEVQLEDWSEGSGEVIHQTVWDQMTAWLENLELAFANQRLPLREWLPIVEAGLDGLTVGVVPPVLDQVLVGTVDRSRNPDLKMVFVLGFNEGVFPAVPPYKPLLTDQDRTALLSAGLELANVPSLQVSQEQFYGYIACTRAQEKVILSYARTDGQGVALNPSRFVGQVRTLFPKIEVEFPRKPRSLAEVEHASELSVLDFSEIPTRLRERVRTLPTPKANEQLEPELARRLYSTELRVSVVAMERYASCAFRFFAEQGLKVREREQFKLDIREQGSFQHQVLARFHERVRAAKKRWRDLSVAEARAWIGRIADEEMVAFKDGLLSKNEQNRFTGENYKAALQDFIAAAIEWFDSNQFDPQEVELPFGKKDEGLPGWQIPLENGCSLVLGGRIDRADLFVLEDGSAICLVMDYKSGLEKPDETLLHYGIQQQLPAYLLALTRISEAKQRFGVRNLQPGGCFYVPLTARYGSAPTRLSALSSETSQTAVYKHYGIFDYTHIARLDARYAENDNPQFNYNLNKDLQPRADRFSALQPDRFAAILERLEANTREFGRAIYGGNIAIFPFKKGFKTGCDRCPHQSVCRFDPWVQEFNVLRSPEPNA